MEKIPYTATHREHKEWKKREESRLCWIDLTKNDVEQKGLKMNKAIKLVQDRKQ